MGRQRVVAFALAAWLVAVLAGCSGGDGNGSESKEAGETTLAVINGRPLTTADMESHISGMTPDAQKEFKSPAMMSSLIDREINMRVWAEAARDAGLDKTPAFDRMMKSAEISILAELYTVDFEKKASDFSDEELRAAYERDKDTYSRPGWIHARHILCSSEAEAQEALAAVRGGMPFEQAVAKYSRDDATRARSGDLGKITKKSAIPGLGVDTKFYEEISKIEPGHVGGPIHSRRGFHVVQVIERTPDEVRPFSEVKPQIERKLTKEIREAGATKDLQALWQKYDVKVNQEAIKRYIGYPVTPEEYVRDIREATSSGDKIRLCQEMVSRFPGNKYAPYALLTMGFTYSEELHNYVDSAKAFNLLIEKYPDSSLVDAARWMLNNMQRPHPPIRNVEHLVEVAKGAGG